MNLALVLSASKTVLLVELTNELNMVSSNAWLSHLKCSTENYLCFEVNRVNLSRHVFASRGVKRTDNSSMAEMCSVCLAQSRMFNRRPANEGLRGAVQICTVFGAYRLS